MEKQHHLFVQGIMSRKKLDKKEFVNFYRACLRESEALNTNSTQPEIMQKFMTTIRNSLKGLDCDILKCFDECTGESYYVWVVTREREWQMKISSFTPAQSEYFRKLLEEIVTSNNGFIKGISALNLTDEMEHLRLTKTDAQETLKLLEKFGFIGTDEGCIYLGVAGLAEFEKYLKDNFEDHLHSCEQCEKIVIYGTRCDGCDNRFHRYCLKRYISNVKRNECPKCQSHLSIV